jgi:hypothetical protein
LIPPNILQYFFKISTRQPTATNRGTGAQMTHFVTVAVRLSVKWQSFLPKTGRIGRKHTSNITKTGLAHGLKILLHEAQH